MFANKLPARSQSSLTVANARSQVRANGRSQVRANARSHLSFLIRHMTLHLSCPSPTLFPVLSLFVQLCKILKNLKEIQRLFNKTLIGLLSNLNKTLIKL